MGNLLWAVLEQASLVSLGACLFAIVVLFARRPGRWYWYVGVKAGLLITQGLLLFRLEQGGVDTLPSDPVTITYLVALAVMAVSLIGVATDISRSAGHRIGRGGPPPSSVAQGLEEERNHGKT